MALLQKPIEFPAPDLSAARERISEIDTIRRTGRVAQIVGLVIESNGPAMRIGEVCHIERSADKPLLAEAVGFRRGRVLLMPIGEMEGVCVGNETLALGKTLRAPVGPQLLGRVLNSVGEPIDGLGPMETTESYPVIASPPHAMDREIISEPMSLGVRAIDGFLTCGKGQRVGIFAGSGVGKSTLLGMIARGGGAAVNVIALIGERGREVREFIENDLGEEGLSRSVVVVATSDQPAMYRIKAAFTATAIAEYFRDQGLEVMLMMDSVTRLAMAQREVGLAIGEPPSTKGYTPSVFAMLPKLLERSGRAKVGAITALYTVLVEGDDTNEPIADSVRSILDGHIVLSRALAHKGHYPPIDILHSLSRVMNMVTDKEHLSHAMQMRELLSTYRDSEDLISIGAYQAGSNPKIDRSIAKSSQLEAFLRQAKDDPTPYQETLERLGEMANA